MEKHEFTELELIYQKAIEKLSGQVADLSANLSLARANLELIEEAKQKKNDTEK